MTYWEIRNYYVCLILQTIMISENAAYKFRDPYTRAY